MRTQMLAWLLANKFDTFSDSNLLDIKFNTPNVFQQLKLSAK